MEEERKNEMEVAKKEEKTPQTSPEA